MKIRIAITAVLVLSAALTCWLLLRKPPENAPSPNVAPRPGIRETSPVAASRVIAGAKPAGEERARGFSTDKLHAWLESKGRSAEALVAAWELTEDPALEAELAEKHAGNALVCLALLEGTGGGVNQAWVERLRAAAPDHPLPDCLDAAAAAKSGDLAAARAALARALERKGPRDSRQAERMAMLREAAAGAGVDARTAAFAPAKVLERNTALITVAQGGQALLRKAGEGAFADTEEAAATAITLSAHLDTGRGNTLLHDVSVAGIQEKALNFLPPDTELGETGRTLDSALAAKTELVSVIKQSAGVSERMEQATPKELDTYWTVFSQHSEAAALRWVIGGMKPEEIPPSPEQ